MRVLTLVLALTAGAAQADIWTFETPSTNIQCVVGLDFEFSDLTCTIIEKGGTPPIPRPTSCGADWGHTFFMNDTGSVQMLCEPLNPIRGAQHIAEYGVTGEFGGFVCHSSTSGLECRNTDGHGFFLSRAVQRVY
ncbi:MAG: DUF6636 domain-containing protein [Pseudomonadota bacterium]